MISSSLRLVRILSRAPGNDQSLIGQDVHPDLLVKGDTFVCVELPVYRVDPKTRQCTTDLRKFEMLDGGNLRLA